MRLPAEAATEAADTDQYSHHHPFYVYATRTLARSLEVSSQQTGKLIKCA